MTWVAYRGLSIKRIGSGVKKRVGQTLREGAVNIDIESQDIFSVTRLLGRFWERSMRAAFIDAVAAAAERSHELGVASGH